MHFREAYCKWGAQCNMYRKDSRAPPQLPNFCKDLNPREKVVHPTQLLLLAHYIHHKPFIGCHMSQRKPTL